MASPIAPTAGFSIKLNGPHQTRYYINVCSHEALGRPIDAQDRPVSDEHIESLGIDNLRVPLLTGPARTIEVGGQQDLEAVVVDVVFHPSVVMPALSQPDPDELEVDNLLRRRAILGRMMRARLVELAVKNIEDDLRMKLGRDMKLPRGLTYVGGLGEKKTRPMPMTALKQLVQQSLEAENRRKLESAPGPWRSTRASVGLDNRKAPPHVSELATGEEASTKNATKLEVVRKGFFNNNKKPLYPEGSTEGTPPPGAGDPLGWMPPKLRSRVAVVDTKNLSEAEQRKMMEDDAAPKPAGHVPVDSTSTAVHAAGTRAAPIKAEVHAPANTTHGAQRQGTQSSKHASDSTFSSFSAELAAEAIRMAETTDPKAFLQQMEALAGSLGIADKPHEARRHEHNERIGHHSPSLNTRTDSDVNASPCATSASPASTAPAQQVLSAACTPDYTLVEQAGQVVLRVPLRGVSSMAEVEAEISDQSFSLRAPSTQLRLDWPCKLDSSAAKACFLKKKGVLQVTLPISDVV